MTLTLHSLVGWTENEAAERFNEFTFYSLTGVWDVDLLTPPATREAPVRPTLALRLPEGARLQRVVYGGRDLVDQLVADEADDRVYRYTFPRALVASTAVSWRVYTTGLLPVEPETPVEPDTPDGPSAPSWLLRLDTWLETADGTRSNERTLLSANGTFVYDIEVNENTRFAFRLPEGATLVGVGGFSYTTDLFEQDDTDPRVYHETEYADGDYTNDIRIYTSGGFPASGPSAEGDAPAGSYAGRDDLVARFGPGEISRLLDRDDDGSEYAGALAAVLADSAAEVDSVLSEAFALPLGAGPWPLLVAIQCDLARLRLYDENATDTVRNRASSARKGLRELADGKRSLVNAAGLPAARPNDPISTVSAPERLLGDDALEGLA